MKWIYKCHVYIKYATGCSVEQNYTFEPMDSALNKLCISGAFT